MTVITLSRELGSRGDDVAVVLAERLGLRIVGRELINRAARAAGAPEVALAEIDELGLLGVRISAATLAEYREKVTAVLNEQANGGDVLLVGRGGQVALRAQPEVLHVRIIAPLPMRVALVRERCNISEAAAAARVASSDKARAAFLRRTHQARWDDPLLYDLIINMAGLTVGEAVAIVAAAAQQRNAPGTSLPRGAATA
jgi:cytidylate kinase